MIASVALTPVQVCESVAWLLELGPGLHAAIGERELQHLVLSPPLFTVPGSPFDCRKVMLWNDRVVPVMDLAARLTGQAVEVNTSLIGIVAYLGSSDRRIQFGGVRLHAIPERTLIHDEQACELPQAGFKRRTLAHSCFADKNNNPIPILNLSRIFSKPARAKS